MRRLLVASLVTVALVTGGAARAEESQHESPDRVRIDLGLRGGAELPAGGIERGSNASDLTYGGLPVALDAGVSLSRRVSMGLWASYALTIPKLCASTSDCTQSGGRDVELALSTRVRLPRIAWLTPIAEGGLGYEWSTRVLEASGVEGKRTFEGPMMRLAIVPTVKLSRRFDLGLALGGRIGVAHRVGVEAPGVNQDRGPDGAQLGGTLDLALRLGTSL
jgi:hypothetical protein